MFFEIEFCGFVTKLMTVGHVVWFLGRLNPAEPVCEEPSLMIHRGRVLVWLWLDPGRANLHGQDRKPLGRGHWEGSAQISAGLGPARPRSWARPFGVSWVLRAAHAL